MKSLMKTLKLTPDDIERLLHGYDLYLENTDIHADAELRRTIISRQRFLVDARDADNAIVIYWNNNDEAI